MEDTEYEVEFEFPDSITAAIKETILLPFRILTSPTLLRTYLRTILVLLASISLFVVAVLAYTSFYYAYIPVRGISVPVYLQFDARSDQFPYGIARIADNLMPRQKYDVVVDMELPRSVGNMALGNWMVGVELKGPGEASTPGVKHMLGFTEEWDVEDYSVGCEGAFEKEMRTPEEVAAAAVSEKNGKVIARSRRPAILTYRSWMTELAYRTLRMPWYLLGWGQEAERVSVRVMEGVEFQKGWRNVPRFLRLETRSREPLEVYRVWVRFEAQLGGLRYIMHNYRILSLLAFTSIFWSVSMTLLFLTWAAFSFLFSHEGADHRTKIKQEEPTGFPPGTPKTEDSSAPASPLSDTSRIFPTLPSQAPLRYSSSEGKIKVERGETPRLEDVLPNVKTEERLEEADDEEDYLLDEPLPVDSGIGTSMESEGVRGLLRRRSESRRKEERR